MRVTGGTLGGRLFNPPADKWPTRPTTEISRQALFNILSNHLDFENTIYLDLFGGTGAHTYEMISRGCTSVDYVDLHRPCVLFAKKTCELFKINQYVRFHNSDVFAYLNHCKTQYDYIFAGPPYELPKIPDIPTIIMESDILKEDGLFVIEHHQQHSFEDHPHFQKAKHYGMTWFSFFSKRINA